MQSYYNGIYLSKKKDRRKSIAAHSAEIYTPKFNQRLFFKKNVRKFIVMYLGKLA